MKKIKFILSSLGFIFLCPLLFASVVTTPTKTPEETLKTLIKTDKLIIIGTVSKQSSYYGSLPDFGQNQIIVTDYLVHVEKILKGEKKIKDIIVKIPGGCIKEENQCFETDIAPRFYDNETYLLFLNPTSDGKWYLWDFINGRQVYHEPKFDPLGFTLDQIMMVMQGGSL